MLLRYHFRFLSYLGGCRSQGLYNRSNAKKTCLQPQCWRASAYALMAGTFCSAVKFRRGSAPNKLLLPLSAVTMHADGRAWSFALLSNMLETSYLSEKGDEWACSMVPRPFGFDVPQNDGIQEHSWFLALLAMTFLIVIDGKFRARTLTLFWDRQSV